MQGWGSFGGGASVGAGQLQGRGRWEEKAPPPHSGFLSQGLGLTGGGILEQTELLEQFPQTCDHSYYCRWSEILRGKGRGSRWGEGKLRLKLKATSA